MVLPQWVVVYEQYTDQPEERMTALRTEVIGAVSADQAVAYVTRNKMGLVKVVSVEPKGAD